MHRLFYLLLAFLASVVGAGAQVGTGPLNGHRFWGEIHIGAPPDAVWSNLTSTTKMCVTYGLECQADSLVMKQVGDSFPSIYIGDTGTFVLTYVDALAEIRYTWEPGNGSYLCQMRWRLIPSDTGTRVLFEERYTVSGVMSPGMLKSEVERYGETMARFKRLCEQGR